VIIACNSTQRVVLQAEFPELDYRILPGYDLQYGKSRRRTLGRIIIQIPKILISINRENRWLRHLLQQQPVDAILSDNRFGLYTKRVPTVFITHQLAIKTGLGNWADRIVQWFNYRAINRFSACWLPDHKDTDALAGELSHPAELPATPVYYLGPLSRFTSCNRPFIAGHLLFILSGPEPQRSLFEMKILDAVHTYPGQVTLVRGCPGNEVPVTTTAQLTIYQHVDAATLNELACSADIIISRSGYTTVMDILKMGKKNILVPTPGQAEQEYLATYLHQKRLIYAVSQEAFDLSKAIEALAQFPLQMHSRSMDTYKIIIREFIDSLSK